MHTRRSRRTADCLALLQALAAGGQQNLIEIEDWETFLQGCPALRGAAVSRWFLAALRHEWLPLDPPTSLCAQVTDHVQGYLSGRLADWAGLWGHITRVTGCAGWIAQRRGIDPEAAYLAAVLHDVCKLDETITGSPHEEASAVYAVSLLRGELPRRQLGFIVEAIRAHPDRPAPSWGVARVLFDADKLDKIGAAGLLRRASSAADIDEACAGAERMLDDADAFPALCMAVSTVLLRPRLAFCQTLEPLLPDLYADW